ncbi:MAG: hypothetical protein MJ187_03040 [Alphaproteobacteria bacterium]|nr:hypothetical protein [Alphaproteobacteria bacterium]
MNKIISFIAICLLTVPTFAATQAHQTRRASTTQFNQFAPRTNRASQPFINNQQVSSGVVIEEDAREKERSACINNNIGVGNTFVWASKFSNTNDYSTMIEDTENPDNNTCFVRVELKSNDSAISVSDISAKYYEMGQSITCGDWVNEDKIKDRILDAKKTARVWGTIGASVGGAGLGVGAMELFGNKVIGGDVEGQYSLSGADLLISQIKDQGNTDQFCKDLKDLRDACVASGNAADACQSDNGAYKGEKITQWGYYFNDSKIKSLCSNL